MARYKDLYLSYGNKKLRETAETAFLVWNLPSWETCPFATPQCMANCYAKKAEKQYPGCLPCRERNYAASLKPSFVGDMVYFISRTISHKSKCNKKIIFRIHESGDFYSREYAKKWVAIAHAFTDKNIVFMVYTKSITFFDGLPVPDNFVIRCSLWDDSPEEFRKRVDGMPIYTALPKNELDVVIASGKGIECRCDDCATCGKCWDRTQKNIIVPIH